MPSLSQVNLESYLLAQLPRRWTVWSVGRRTANRRSGAVGAGRRWRWRGRRRTASGSRRSWRCWGLAESARRCFWAWRWTCCSAGLADCGRPCAGPHSISLQQTATTALASGWYPEKTSMNPEHWHWVHCQVECGRRRKVHELVLADIAGDAWAQEADRPGSHVAAPAILAKCAAVVVVADAERLHAGDHNADFVVHKLLSTIGELSGGSRRKADQRPLAVVFTKTDACPRAADDPLSFAESHCRAVNRLREPVPEHQGVRHLGRRRQRQPRPPRPPPPRAATDRTARRGRAVWLAADATLTPDKKGTGPIIASD